MKKKNEQPGIVPVGPGVSGEFMLNVPSENSKMDIPEKEPNPKDEETKSIVPDPKRASEYDFLTLFMEP